MGILKPKYVYKNIKSADFVARKIVKLEVSKIIIVVDANIRNRMISELLRAFHLKLNVVKLIEYPGGEPTTEYLNKFLLSISELDYHAFVGIGGGSTLDFTKAASVLSTQELMQDSSDYQGVDFEVNSKKFCICIPSTAGSGAEATKSAVMFNPKTNIKRGVNNLKVMPDAVFLIPSLISNLPEEIFYPSLFDGITHAYESLIGKSSTKKTSRLARKSLSLYKKQLRDKQSKESYHKKVLEASFLAGQAICNSETGPVHALSYPLSEYLKLSHGQAIALVLPKVLLTYKRLDISLVTPLVDGLGFKDFDSLVNKIQILNQNYNKASIKDYSNFELETFALRSLELKGAINNSPIVWTYDNSMEVYQSILESSNL